MTDLISGALLLIVIGAAVVLFARRDRAQLGCVVLFLAFVSLPVVGAFTGSPLHRYQGLARRADTIVTRVEEAAVTFCDDTGAYPRSVTDLAATSPPRSGLDASGNEVALAAGWRGPYLTTDPAAPTRGGRWLMDPLNAQLVDDGGLQVSVEPVTHERLLEVLPWE